MWERPHRAEGDALLCNPTMIVKSATYDIKAAMKSTLALISVAMKPEGSHQRTNPNTRRHLDRDE